MLWEATIATFADSADKLSLGAYGRRLVAAGVPDAETFRVPPVGAVTAVIVLLAVAAAGIWLGGRRLGGWSSRSSATVAARPQAPRRRPPMTSVATS